MIDRRSIAAIIIPTITTTLDNPLDPHQFPSPTLDYACILLGLLLRLSLFRRAMDSDMGGRM